MTCLFPKGPKIHLYINVDKNTVSSIYLEHSNAFSCSFSAFIKEESAILEWLSAYSEKKTLPPILWLDKKGWTPFQENVLKNMSLIAFGKTESYGSLAKKAGSPRAARAVGNICRANPFPLFYPCHRVIHQNGSLGGFAYGIKLKEKLLEFEGATAILHC